MMTNDPNIQRELFPIPSEIQPENTRCLTVRIPDSDDHERVFYGTLNLLTKWHNWVRTGDTTGSQLALIWRQVIGDIVACEDDMAIQDIRTNNCTIEYLQGGEWLTLIDLSICAGQDGEDGQNGQDGQDGQDGEDGSSNDSSGFQGDAGNINDEQLACNFATGIAIYLVREFRDSMEFVRSSIQAGVILVDAVTGLVDVIPVVGPAISALTDLASDLAEKDITDIISLSDADREEEILCQLICWILERNTDNFDAEDMSWLLFEKLQSWSFVQLPIGPFLTLWYQAFAIWLGTVSVNSILFRGTIAKDNEADCQFCDDCPDFGLCWNFETMQNASIILGARDLDFGRPKPSIANASGIQSDVYPLNATGETVGIVTAVRVDFDQPKHIDKISFSYWMEHNRDSKIGFGYRTYAQNGVQTTVGGYVDDNAADGEWHTFNHDFPNVVEFAYMVVYIYRTTDPEFNLVGSGYIDNVCAVEGTP